MVCQLRLATGPLPRSRSPYLRERLGPPGGFCSPEYERQQPCSIRSDHTAAATRLVGPGYWRNRRHRDVLRWAVCYDQRPWINRGYSGHVSLYLSAARGRWDYRDQGSFLPRELLAPSWGDDPRDTEPGFETCICVLRPEYSIPLLSFDRWWKRFYSINQLQQP